MRQTKLYEHIDRIVKEKQRLTINYKKRTRGSWQEGQTERCATTRGCQNREIPEI